MNSILQTGELPKAGDDSRSNAIHDGPDYSLSDAEAAPRRDPPSTEPGTLGMFSSEKERKDIAVGLALSGQDIESAIKYLERFYSARQNIIEQTYRPQLAELDRQINTMKERAETNQTLQGDYEKTAESARSELIHIEASIPALESKKNDAWQKILQHRVEGGRNFFRDQEEHLTSSLTDNRKEIVEEIDAQIEIDRKIYQIQKTNREINSAEFKRRVDLCSEEKRQVEKQLDEASKYADNLKKIGVTRTSATFLFVAGFISLAGVGSVISNLLYDRQPGEDVLARIIRNMGSIVDGMIPPQLEHWRSSVKPLLFVLLLLLFLGAFYGLIRLMDWLVRKFDHQTWNAEREEDQESSRLRQASPKTLHDQFAGFASSALSFSSQLTTFLPFNIERRGYTKLLASFPYLFLGGIIVFLFSSGGQVLSLTTVYIGVIFALLATSVSVLYVTKVIEPRWDEAGRDGSNETGRKRAFARYVRINRELTGLFALMIFSLVLASFMPAESQTWSYLTGQQTKLIVWGFVAVFMCLSSLGLAYGIIQRGIFRDVDHLIKRRNDFRALIERFSMEPVIGSSGYGRNYGSDLRSMNYFDLLQSLQEQKLWYELNEIFADDFEFNEDPPKDTTLPFLWFKFRRPAPKGKPAFLGLRLKKDLPIEPRIIDFSSAPEQTAAFLSAREELNSSVQKKAEFSQRLNSLTQKIALLRQERNTLRSEILTLEKQKVSVERELGLQFNTLTMVKEKDLMEFRGSFAIGAVARSLLEDEGVLPEAPGTANGEQENRKREASREAASEVAA